MRGRYGLLSPEISWALLRIFLGFMLLRSGLGKLASFNESSLTGVLNSWINGGGSVPPNPNLWYVDFLKGIVIPNAGLFSSLVIYGEILIGIALILGLFTGIVALVGAFMNANYFFAASHTSASTLSVNALFIVVQLLFALACVGQYYGADYYLLRLLWPKRTGVTAKIASTGI